MNTVELGQLRYGHDEGAPAGISNPRKANRTEGLEQLTASIRAQGIIQPLAVVAGAAGVFYVAEGNRRLRALEGLRDAGEIPDTYPVPVHEIGLGVAQEAALAANIVRVPLHEADQYEAFKSLADEGLTEAAIASRFAIDTKRVRRILALGRLSPMILQAWRDGRLGYHAEETVKAFTLAPSLKDQERVFKRLSKTDSVSGYNVRQEFGAGRGDAGRFLTFVGKEAYEAAGGKVTEDLFGTNHVISDPALAKRLADEKLKAECERLVAEGWSWASPVGDLPDGARWQWPTITVTGTPTPEEQKRLEELQAILDADDPDPEAYDDANTEADEIEERIKARGYDAATKARSGCVVSVGQGGQLEIRYGVMKPAASKSPASTSTKASAKDKAAPAISNALAHRLSIQLTQAAATAVTQHPNRAFEIAVAALLANQRFSLGARLNHDGLASKGPTRLVEFHDAYRNVTAMAPEQQLEVLATVVGKSLSFESQNAQALPLKDKSVATICEALGAEMVAATRQAFDAEDYFGSISKPLILKAIEEALNADEARKATAKPKAELVKFAVANVPQTGWLPAELRTSHYDGPGSQPRKKPKAAPKPKDKKAQTKPAKAKAKTAGRAKSMPEAKAA